MERLGKLIGAYRVALYIGLLPFTVGGPELGAWAKESTVKPASKYDSQDSSGWVAGPSLRRIGEIAKLSVPEGILLGDSAATQSFLERTQVSASGREIAIVVHEQSHWYAVFEFDSVGYFRGGTNALSDSATLLDQIKRDNEALNIERNHKGWPTIEVLDWKQPPQLDRSRHSLSWAILARSNAREFVNHHVRLLGRRGAMKVSLATSEPDHSVVHRELMRILDGFEYVEGEAYSDHQQGDRFGTVRLEGLVLGYARSRAIEQSAPVSTTSHLLEGTLAAFSLTLVSLLFLKRKHQKRPTPEETAMNIEASPIEDTNYPAAIVGAGVGAMAGAGLWWGFTSVTNIAFGLVAAAIGFLAGHGALRLSGGRGSVPLQGISIGAAMVGFLFGTYLVNRTFINNALVESGQTGRVPWVPENLEMLGLVLQAGFSPMDLLFLGIVVWTAWSIPRPVPRERATSEEFSSK